MNRVDWPKMSESLKHALALANKRVPSFPCAANKRPATPHGFKEATTDPIELQELWRRFPGPLIGVPTGNFSGLDVLDIDPRHGGDSWLADRQSCLPITRMHRTRSGGLHLFFQHAFDLRCSAGKLGPGVDVRANGGYVIWWPACGFSVISEAPSAPWPDWLRAHLSSRARLLTPRVTVPDSHALTRLVQLVASARDGERNELTFWAACRAGEMVASGLLGSDAAAALIAEAGTRAGLSRTEAERTAWSGIRTTGGFARA
jgi:hypothetical protein